ncbi:hypothetical protein MESS4_330026 [Mesorhizobium sp. STM 4661]|nr:hypothetical protein MESS4_330026 [Mesorhizobium sp. STM 4661]
MKNIRSLSKGTTFLTLVNENYRFVYTPTYATTLTRSGTKVFLGIRHFRLGWLTQP